VKGHGDAFHADAKIDNPDAVLFPEGRAEHGSRQRQQLMQAFAVFMNSDLTVDWMFKHLVKRGEHGASILSRSVYVRITSLLYMAALRARSIMWDKVGATLMVLCNGAFASDKWGLRHMATVADALYAAMEVVQDDPSCMRSAAHEVFALEEFPILTAHFKHKLDATLPCVGTKCTVRRETPQQDKHEGKAREDVAAD
jgi:hypothetical protein